MAVTGLVLQGGGALGAFELGVIECLLDGGIKPDVVSGVSIGAINATVLCGCRNNNPKVSLAALWEDLTTPSVPLQLDVVNENISVFGNPGMYLPRTDYLNILRWTSFYDTSPLVATLEKHVDFDKLTPQNLALAPHARAPRLILTATDLLAGRLDKFDSKHMAITPAHVRASGSLPPSFPPTLAAAPRHAKDGERLYWDGGLFDNTPLSKVIDALQESDDPDKSMYVVNLFPSAAPAPQNMPEVLARMMTLAFSNKADKDLKRAHQTTALIRFVDELDRLMQKHDELKPLAKLSGYEVMKQFKAPIHIVEITNQDATGAADFSAQGIARRRRAGYEAAADKISKTKAAA
jgi:NTE family protein